MELPSQDSVDQRLLLTRSSLHRHAKRLRKEFAGQGVDLNLTGSQEALSRILGWKNWHEAVQLTAYPSSLRMPLIEIDPFVAEPTYSPELYVGPRVISEFLEFISASQRAGFSRWWIQDGEMFSETPVTRKLFRLMPPGVLWSNKDVQDLIVELGALAHGHHHVQFGEFVCSSNLGDGNNLRLVVGVVELCSDGNPSTHMYFKAVPSNPPALSHLKFPKPLLAHLLKPQKGFGIFSAACSLAGVTTSLNALIRSALENGPARVVMLEDFPEYPFAGPMDVGRAVIRAGLSQQQIRNASPHNPTLVIVDGTSTVKYIDDLLPLSFRCPVWVNISRGHGVPDVLRRLMSMVPPADRLERWKKLWATLSTIVVQARSSSGEMLWEYLIVDEVLRQDMLGRSSIPESLVDLQLLLKKRACRFIDNARSGTNKISENELLRQERSHEQSERWREDSFLLN